jgi:hypothetical protein
MSAPNRPSALVSLLRRVDDEDPRHGAPPFPSKVASDAEHLATWQALRARNPVAAATFLMEHREAISRARTPAPPSPEPPEAA